MSALKLIAPVLPGPFEAVKTLDINLKFFLEYGFADLIVKSVTTDSLNTVKNGECEYKDTVGKTVLTTLRYDGRQYVVPEDLKGL